MMSVALAHPVPTAPRPPRSGGEQSRRSRLRLVEGGRERRGGAAPGPAEREVGRGAGASSARWEAQRRQQVPAVRHRSGMLLVPLGEVLVPAGRRPVLRLLPVGGPVELAAAAAAGAVPPASGTGRAARPDARTSTHPRRTSHARRAGTAARRRRAALALLALVVAAGAARVSTGGGGGGVAEAAPPAALPAPQVLVVEEGQTLWSLARDLAPGADPRVMVERLRAVNSLEGAGLAVGQRLVLPLP